MCDVFKSVVGGHRFEDSGQRFEAYPGIALFLRPWFEGPGASKTSTAASPHHAVWLCVDVRVGVSSKNSWPLLRYTTTALHRVSICRMSLKIAASTFTVARSTITPQLFRLAGTLHLFTSLTDSGTYALLC